MINIIELTINFHIIPKFVLTHFYCNISYFLFVHVIINLIFPYLLYKNGVSS